MVIVASCNNSNNGIEANYLDIQSPFNFSWAKTDEFVTDAKSDCIELIRPLGSLLNSSQKDKALLECKGEEYSTIFIPVEEIPVAFKDGEISVSLLGGTKPVQYTYSYSYLHDLVQQNLDERSKLRKAHAADIKNKLIRLYGQPNANGHFDQGTPFGFVVDNEIDQPCSFWLNKDIGILLCAERVVLIDGIEMSLSFTNLDEKTIGQQTRDMILRAAGISSKPENSELKAINNSSFSKAGLIEMSELVFNDDLDRCSKSDLKPITDFWVKSETKNTLLEHIFIRYSGEELAEYVFEYFAPVQNDLPKIEKDFAIMALLKRAAEQGSASAMNEIGASLLYCYQGVQQDVGVAIEWLNKAAEAGDGMAMRTIASLHLANSIGLESSKYEALNLLEQCSKISPEDCLEEYQTLKAFILHTDQQ